MAAPRRPTRSVSVPNERLPMIGLSGLVSTSRSGTKSQLMPAARHSDASASPIRRAMSSESMRPSARSGGHTVHGGPMRATRPPSWSTPMTSGSSCPHSRAKVCSSFESSATCSGPAMLRAK